jgi:hypothetical protein
MPDPEHAIDLPVRPDAALSALRRAVDDWGAELRTENGETWLDLPVVHGLKRGYVSGRVRVETQEEGARIAFQPEETRLYVQTASIFILTAAILGALPTILWPFFPRLLPLAPFGAILALGGWFLVLSRLRNSGPAEFLMMVETQAEAGAPTAEA